MFLFSFLKAKQKSVFKVLGFDWIKIPRVFYCDRDSLKKEGAVRVLSRNVSPR